MQGVWKVTPGDTGDRRQGREGSEAGSSWAPRAQASGIPLASDAHTPRGALTQGANRGAVPVLSRPSLVVEYATSGTILAFLGPVQSVLPQPGGP